MDYLTQQERDVINQLGKIWYEITEIVGDKRTRQNDLDEIAYHIHLLQQTIMAQAAGRAYPDEFRLLGELIK